jgi:exodeoxyribonuclease VII large subunit
MPEKTPSRTIFTLAEVTASIRKTLTERYTSSFWIKAEMNKVNHYPQSGHCYPDLVEKADGKIVAEMRATIWQDDFRRINDSFLNTLHEPLKDGIKILFCAKISYHPVHGLSLRILDIDPTWSLGELEKEKQLTIDRIRKEGLFDMNRSLALPLLPGRIAVISVETSKGYADFRKIIDENEWGYSFFHMLFPALLQGEHAVASILYQFEQIRKVKDHFDAVAIIRGGGGDVGLTCYNNYDLAKTIVLFPLPVFTGIGHSTNETVAEMVAFKNAITPTELADYLLQKFHNFSVPISRAREIIIEKCSGILREEHAKMSSTVRYFKSVTFARLASDKAAIRQEIRTLQGQSTGFLQRATERHIRQNAALLNKGSAQIFKTGRTEIDYTLANTRQAAASFINFQQKDLEGVAKTIELLNPANIMNRGYSITLFNGKPLKTVQEVQEGSLMETMLADGNITSKAITVNKTDDND